MMIFILLGMMFLGASHPMTLVLLLFVMSILYSLMMYSFMMTFWYGVVMLLVVLSGVLVIFTYMASVTPDEKFEMSGVVVAILLMLMSGLKVYEGWMLGYSLDSIKLWEGIVSGMVIFLVVFLLVVMILVIWMSGWNQGAVKGYW